MYPLRIAQISDLHFAALSFNPLQFFSKRCLGNINSLFSRKKVFFHERLLSLASLFKEEQIGHVIVTGDLSTTSHIKEFRQAQQFLKNLESNHLTVHSLPGNHDNYTKRSFKKKIFYRFFNPLMKDAGFSVAPLSPGFWLITLDTTLATSLISSHGVFSPELEAKLDQTLQEVPPNDRVILANHFPMFEHESSRKSLRRSEQLRALIQKYPQITFYLHGHTHNHCIADLRSSGLPIILDCGSTPHQKGTFHLIEIEKMFYKVKVYRWNEGWKISQEVSFHV